MKYNISYQSDDFKKWFTIDKAKPKEVEVSFDVTKKSMTSQEILDEMKPSILTLNEFAYILKKELINKTDWYIYFVKDKNDIIRAVYARWLEGRGWSVHARELEDDDQWYAGYPVVSRKKSDTSSDTQTLKHSDTTALKEKLDDFIQALQKLRKTL